MASIAVVNADNEKVGTLELSDAVFGIEPNEAAVHAVVVNYLANQRQGQWRHGGIALGPKPRCYRYTLNKKLRRLAMKSALSAKVAEGDMIVLDAFTMSEYKTKEVVKMLSAVGADRKVLLVMPEKNDMVIASARNIPGVKTALVNTLNVYDIVNADKFVVVKDAVAQIEEVYC